MEETEITQDNFYLGTKCCFKGCKRPKRAANFTSYNRHEEIHSEYWYGEDKKGKYVIRCSDHWSKSNNEEVFSCEKISSCYWWITTNCKKIYFHENPYNGFHCGKAYFSRFKIN